ncbi:hypothetical protein VNI00_017946 [Paramarasmius palmivorus]|uniref:Uncharacterized protein n=1 Tax=Paramarasmius palmivorus TaxID=297713 RepID=A0AAW0B260_9AGAR
MSSPSPQPESLPSPSSDTKDTKPKKKRLFAWWEDEEDFPLETLQFMVALDWRIPPPFWPPPPDNGPAPFSVHRQRPSNKVMARLRAGRPEKEIERDEAIAEELKRRELLREAREERKILASIKREIEQEIKEEDKSSEDGQIGSSGRKKPRV